MGFNKKRKERKRGPKGKRARAKAKLERQWGEMPVADVPLRHGKSRLLQQQETTITKQQVNDAEEYKDEMNVHMSSEESDSESEDEQAEGALNLLLQSIRKSSREMGQSHDSDDDEEESSSNESDGEMSVDDDDDASKQVAHVEEESNDESVLDHDDDDDDDNGVSDTDPFSCHFNREPLSDKELSKATTSKQMSKVTVPDLDSCLEFYSSQEAEDISDALALFACNRKVLLRAWKQVNAQAINGSNKKRLLSPLQSALYPSLATYKDVFIAGETRENHNQVRNILSLHLLNHVLTSRGRIQRNNKKVQQDEELSPRDQGFTRPTVLVLLPTRGTCLSFVEKLMSLLGDGARVDNMDRFQQEYGPPEVDDEEEDDSQQRRRRKVMQAKGPEWRELFGENVNDDDYFKTGMSVTPKTAGQGSVAVKLYSDFYRSDIILASPLGLKMALDSKEDEDSQDVDFLSSIEVCLVAHSSVLLMQNWDHVNDVLSCLNHQPKKNNDTDFSRVRNYLLAGQAAHWRQLIIASSLSDPHVVSTFKRHAKSIAGQLKFRRRTPVEDASLCNVLVRVKQVFERISCSSFANQGDDRLRFFEQRILPQIRKQKHTMIFIPSYFDFVSVRNLLLKKEVTFVSVTEYARGSEVTRGRARFLQGIKPLMLYTGRAHFFQCHVIKGVRHLIMYGLPEHSEFYSGLVNELNAGFERNGELDMAAPLSCLSLFTKYDALALERIVGQEHCNRMIKGDKSTFMFSS